MNISPKTEKEIAESNLIPDGIYPFEVISAVEKKSKAGNDMIEIKHRVFLPDGTERLRYDWLLESVPHKLFHFCAYSGLSTQYESGKLSANDMVRKTGYLKMGIQIDKSTGDMQNTIKDYVRAPSGIIKGATPKAASKPDDDVPF